MNYHTYMLLCNDGSYYVGIAANLRKRLFQHTSGIGGPYTKNRCPVKLVYTERFLTRVEAARKEKEIKGWRREKKENLAMIYDERNDPNLGFGSLRRA